MNTLIGRKIGRIRNVARTQRKTFTRYAAKLAILAIGSLTVCSELDHETVAAERLDTAEHLFELVLAEQGNAALEIVMAEAYALGHWGPAPGDVVVYDPALTASIGGAVRFIDSGPVDCANPKIARWMEDCLIDYTAKQNWVRLGRAMFVRETADGNLAPQRAFDDLLATYIEEVGHSWQEYLYETDGRGSGLRLHPTSWEDGYYYQVGWEYQIKRYVLSLDGDQLRLSGEAHARLMDDICASDGYANIIHGHIPLYGAPMGWPHAESWPTRPPTPEEIQVFCAVFSRPKSHPRAAVALG